MIYVEANGHARIFDGEHRLHAAIYADIPALVEIRYFGNSEKLGVLFEIDYTLRPV